jgi:hypothetical protein
VIEWKLRIDKEATSVDGVPPEDDFPEPENKNKAPA